MGNQQLYADLRTKVNSESPEKILSLLINDPSTTPEAFRDMTTNEMIHALVVNKYGLNPEYLTNSQLENPDPGADKARCLDLLLAGETELKPQMVSDLLDVAGSILITNSNKALSSKRPSV